MDYMSSTRMILVSKASMQAFEHADAKFIIGITELVKRTWTA